MKYNTDVAEFCKQHDIDVDSFDTDLTPLTNNLAAAYQDIAKMEKQEPIYDMIAWEHSYNMSKCDHEWFLNIRPKSITDVIEHIDVNRSACFPFSKIGSTKAEVLLNQKFWDYFEAFIGRIDRGDAFRVEHFISVFLKEELRPKAKIEINKIRDICPSDLSHLLLTHMCCMDFSDRFVEAWTRPGEFSAVGVNPFANGWHYLYSEISCFKNGGMADVSQWDSSCFVQAILDDMELTWSLLEIPKGEEVIWRRRIYWSYMMIIYALLVMPTGEVIKKWRSQTSGNGLTTYLNTRIHKRIWYYIWYRCTGSCDVTEMHKFLRIKLYGDDLIYTTHDQFMDVFHPRELVKYYRELGFGLEANSDFVDPLQLVFLNRYFHKIGPYVTFRMKDKWKAISAVLNCMSHKEPYFVIQQIQGVKISYFWYKDIYKILCELETWLIARYANLWNDDINWKRTIRGILTSREIAAIYFGNSHITSGTGPAAGEKF